MKGTFKIALGLLSAFAQVSLPAANLPAPLTPPSPPSPRINGPGVFGVRPGSAFLYTIPATGIRPMKFAATGLPEGLKLDADSGRLAGEMKEKGEYQVVLRAINRLGTAERKFRVMVGEQIALTPPMGWNSWNCWAGSVDQEKVLSSAHAMVSSGLINHGWTYINIDDTWQGERGGGFHAIQPNEKFPDMKALCDAIHSMGLKVGIYSTPWITSYAKFVGGSSDDPAGGWTKKMANEKYWRLGQHYFAENDAQQWGAWGIDYLKFDWNPNDVPHASAMAQALRKTKRDILFSLSNAAPFDHATDWARIANCWRTTGDIRDRWREDPAEQWSFGLSELAFSQERWAPYAGPGHWNDPDMLVVGYVGWGPALHATRLTPDEQYTHISMWCLLSAPLLLGCDLERLDEFTLGLLTNDEVLALDQDGLGRQAVRVAALGPIDVVMEDLEDGSKAIGFFNRGNQLETMCFAKLEMIGLSGLWHVRDLWRQKDLSDAKVKLDLSIPAHGVVLLKLTKAGQAAGLP